MKIGIVIGSVREGRVGASVGKWVHDFAVKRKDQGVTYEVVDLKQFDLPFLGAKANDSQMKAIKNWSEKMASFDGYVYVTPEYNRGVPGAFKNALEFLKAEVADKAVGYVGYGFLSGTFAIANLRVINAEVKMATARTMVTLNMASDFENYSVFKPQAYQAQNMNAMLDEVISWSKALKTIRK